MYQYWYERSRFTQTSNAIVPSSLDVAVAAGRASPKCAWPHVPVFLSICADPRPYPPPAERCNMRHVRKRSFMAIFCQNGSLFGGGSNFSRRIYRFFSDRWSLSLWNGAGWWMSGNVWSIYLA